jgi:hypothetical protein
MLSFPPISRANDADVAISYRKSNGRDATAGRLANAKVALLS